jgi:hypothetical protein
MNWLLRSAWGCLFTVFLLSKGSGVLWRMFGDTLAWRVGVIAVLGFGPALFPLGRGKVLGLVWGLAASFVLLGQPGLDAPTYLLAAWGPLILSTAIGEWMRARRDMGFSKGNSVLRDQTGRAADWTFEADGLEIAMDFAHQELRIRARRARWFDESFKSTQGPVTLIRPLLECSFQWREVKKTEHLGTVAYAYGTTHSGESVRMSVPQEGYSTEYATGEYHLGIDHCATDWQLGSNYVSRSADGSLQYHGRVERKLGKRDITVDLGPLSKDVSAKLRAQWASKVEPKIAELDASFKASRLAEAEAVAKDQYMRDESALRERFAREAAEQRDRAERAAALAAKRLDDLRATHGVGDAFCEMSHDLDGTISWAIAMGPDGKAALIDATFSWAGSLAGAVASVEVVESGGGKAMDTLELAVRVEDPEFERERLAKRRFKIMRGRSKDELLLWADRLQIIAASAVDADPRLATTIDLTRGEHGC